MILLSTAKMYLRRPSRLADRTDLYAHTVRLLDGGQLDLASRRGHPTLIVNTASKCGFTPQYAGLQTLYDTYHERGLELLDRPRRTSPTRSSTTRRRSAPSASATTG